jgi:hypothetical protein
MMQLRTDNERLWKETQYLKKTEKAARSDADQLRSEISLWPRQLYH